MAATPALWRLGEEECVQGRCEPHSETSPKEQTKLTFPKVPFQMHEWQVFRLYGLLISCLLFDHSIKDFSLISI